MLNILIVEDDVTIRELLSYNLKKNFKILEANSAEEAMEVCEHNNIHLILLDWMLPEMSGLSFLRTIKKQKNNSEIPVIFVTAREDEKDKIAGLTSGADDYITKPIKPKVFMSKVKSLLRRLDKNENQEEVITFENFKIDRESYAIYFSDEKYILPRKEFELLYLLASKPEKVITREKIMEKVWGVDVVVGDRTIDVHIRKLREKFGNKYFKTVKGVGYRFTVN